MVRIERDTMDTALLQGIQMLTAEYYKEELKRVYNQWDGIFPMAHDNENYFNFLIADQRKGEWERQTDRQTKLEGVIGKFGLGKRNGKGESLIAFCWENNLIIANTAFYNHPRRRYMKNSWRCKVILDSYSCYIMINRLYNC